MGTNYYHRTKLCPCCGRYDERHIGKSSAGWTFSFQAVRLPDGTEIVSWQDWQRELEKDGVIFDEYGREVPLDEFKAWVEQKKSGPNNHTLYCRVHHPSSNKYNFLDEEGNSFSWAEFS